MPFAGIASLWFMGVVSDRIGFLEDQFFSTVFFDSGLYTLLRAVMLRITNAYAVKMSGVFMISLATISLRAEVMPRALTVASYVLAVGLLLSIGLSLWVTLIFPAWVCAVSIFILVSNLRTRSVSPLVPVE